MDHTSVFERMVAGFSGMEAAERVLADENSSKAIVSKVLSLVQEAGDPDALSDLIEESMPLTAAIPVGMRFWDEIPVVIDWARGNLFSPSSRVAGVSAALIMACSMKVIPPGLWGGEVATVFSAIDKDFVWLVDRATRMASKGMAPPEAFADLKRHGFRPSFELASTIYCCAQSRGSYVRAVEATLASESPQVAILTGAFMGAYDPASVALNPEWQDVVQDMA